MSRSRSALCGVVLALFMVLPACATDSGGASKPAIDSGGNQVVTHQALVSISHVGKMTWSCGGKHPAGYSVALAADKKSATDEVTYNLGGENVSPKKVLQPGRRLATPYSKADQIWHVVQATEPRTLIADITIYFKGCSTDPAPSVDKRVKIKQH